MGEESANAAFAMHAHIGGIYINNHCAYFPALYHVFVPDFSHNTLDVTHTTWLFYKMRWGVQMCYASRFWP
jgi:hypothetical protein